MVEDEQIQESETARVVKQVRILKISFTADYRNMYMAASSILSCPKSEH